MRFITLFAYLFLAVPAAHAGGIAVSDAWIRLLPAGAPAGGYFRLHNEGSTRVELVGAKSAVFGHAMIHRSVSESGRSRMLEVPKVPVPPDGAVTFAPGGYHLMLMKPAAAVRVGADVPITLVFSNGDEVSAMFEVRGPAGR
jgi:copper(I)-binding protein